MRLGSRHTHAGRGQCNGAYGMLLRAQVAQLRTKLDRVVAEARAGQLSGTETEQALRSLASEAPDGRRTAAALTGLVAGTTEDLPGGESSSNTLREVCHALQPVGACVRRHSPVSLALRLRLAGVLTRAACARVQGDEVAVLTMGGAAGTVVQAAGKDGGKVGTPMCEPVQTGSTCCSCCRARFRCTRWHTSVSHLHEFS